MALVRVKIYIQMTKRYFGHSVLFIAQDPKTWKDVDPNTMTMEELYKKVQSLTKHV